MRCSTTENRARTPAQPSSHPAAETVSRQQQMSWGLRVWALALSLTAILAVIALAAQPLSHSTPRLLKSLGLRLSGLGTTGWGPRAVLDQSSGFGLQLSDDDDGGHMPDVEYLGWSDRKLERVLMRMQARLSSLNHTLNTTFPLVHRSLSSQIRTLEQDFTRNGPEADEEERGLRKVSLSSVAEDHRALAAQPSELQFLKEQIKEFLLRQQTVDYDQDKRILSLNRQFSVYRSNGSDPMQQVERKLKRLEKAEMEYIFTIDGQMTTFEKWINSSLQSHKFSKELQDVINKLNNTYHQGPNKWKEELAKEVQLGILNSTFDFDNASGAANSNLDLVNLTLAEFDANISSMETFIRILKAQQKMLQAKIKEFDHVEALNQSMEQLDTDSDNLARETFKFGHRLSARIDPCHRERVVVRHFELILELLAERKVAVEQQLAEQQASINKLKSKKLDAEAKRRYQEWVGKNQQENLEYARKRARMWRQTLQMMGQARGRGGKRIEHELELIEIQDGMIRKVLKLLGAAKMSEARSESKKLLDFVTENNEQAASSARELQTLSTGLVIDGSSTIKVFKKIMEGMLVNLKENKRLILQEIDAKHQDLNTKEHKILEWEQKKERAFDAQTKAKAKVDFLEAKEKALNHQLNTSETELSNSTASWPHFLSAIDRKAQAARAGRRQVELDLQSCISKKGSGSRREILSDASLSIAWRFLQSSLRAREKAMVASSKDFNIPHLLSFPLDNSRLREEVQDNAGLLQKGNQFFRSSPSMPLQTIPDTSLICPKPKTLSTSSGTATLAALNTHSLSISVHPGPRTLNPILPRLRTTLGTFSSLKSSSPPFR